MIRGNHSPQGQCPCRAAQPGLAAPRRHAGVRGASTSPASQLKIENLKTSNFHSAKNSRRRLGAGSRGTPPAPGQPRGPVRDAGTGVARGRWPQSGRRVAPAAGTAQPRSPRGCCGTGHGAGRVWTEGAAPIATACFPSCGRPFACSQLTSTWRLKIPKGRAREGAQQAEEAAPSPPCPFAFRACWRAALSRTARPLIGRTIPPASTDYSCPRAVPEPHPVFSCCFFVEIIFEPFPCAVPGGGVQPCLPLQPGLEGGNRDPRVCALTPCWGQRCPPAVLQNGSPGTVLAGSHQRSLPVQFVSLSGEITGRGTFPFLHRAGEHAGMELRGCLWGHWGW